MQKGAKDKKRGTKVLLVLANSFLDNLIPLGISLLAGCLKQAGHEVRLFDTTFYKTRERTGDDARVATLQVKYTDFAALGIFPKETEITSDFKKLIREFEPDLIAVSVVESTYLIGLQLLDAIKGCGIPTIMGGVHVTFSPDEVIKEEAVDMICVGEGERALLELAERLRHGKAYEDIPNIWTKRDGRIHSSPQGALVNLDDLPYQDWEEYEKQRFYKPMGGKIYIAGAFEMNRGCPYDCAFCCNKKLQDIYKTQGRYYREKSIEILMDEIEKKRSRYGLQYIYIIAENFLMMSEERFASFIEHYKKIGLPFWIETRPDSVMEDRISLLRGVGCEGISIGVEHGNDKFRTDILNKKIKNDTIAKAFRIAKKTGIRTCANNIIGFPTETRKLIFDTIRLNRELKADNVIVNIFTPYRGTKLRQLSIDKGYLDPKAIAGDYRLDTDIRMPHLPPHEIKGLQRTFSMYVKFPEEMWPAIERCEKFDAEGDKQFERLKEIYLKEYM
ncbi:MAG: radical SAM protein [Candidatus Omnitrophota bacterium]